MKYVPGSKKWQVKALIPPIGFGRLESLWWEKLNSFFSRNYFCEIERMKDWKRRWEIERELHEKMTQMWKHGIVRFSTTCSSMRHTRPSFLRWPLMAWKTDLHPRSSLKMPSDQLINPVIKDYKTFYHLWQLENRIKKSLLVIASVGSPLTQEYSLLHQNGTK